MSAKGPTKAELADAIIARIPERDYRFWVSYRGTGRRPRNDGWVPTAADVKRYLLVQNRDQLVNQLHRMEQEQ